MNGNGRNFMAPDRDEIDFSCSAHAREYDTSLPLAANTTQEIWRFYVSPDNTCGSLQFNAIYFLWGSTHAARVTRRAERERRMEKIRIHATRLQSNAHPPTNIPKLLGAFLEYIIYSVFQ
jgi:hypothetical protein